LKVLIHALGADQGGAVRFLSGFLPALEVSKSALESKPVYYILIRDKIHISKQNSKLTFLKVHNWLGSHVLARLIFDNLILPFLMKVKRIDCLVTLTNLGPLWGAKRHINFQRNAVFFSRWYFHQISFKEKIVYLLRKAYLFALMNRATKVIVPSNSMLSSIPKNLVEADPDKFFVFPHAVEKLCPLEVSQVPKRLVEVTSHSQMIFFYPSLYAIYKGFPVLLRALGKLKRIEKLDFKCLFTVELDSFGADRNKISTILRQEQIENDVIFLGNLSFQEADYIYRKTQCLVYPSILESFGFPLAEALSYSLPIIAADTPINREICQNGALYYPPIDSESLAANLKSVYDPTLREKLSNEGKSQFESRDWRWSTYVREFEKLL